jgi:hypothetical protein
MVYILQCHIAGYKLCPDAAFLPVNIRLYVQVSDNVTEIMKGFTGNPSSTVSTKPFQFLARKLKALKQLQFAL